MDRRSFLAVTSTLAVATPAVATPEPTLKTLSWEESCEFYFKLYKERMGTMCTIDLYTLETLKLTGHNSTLAFLVTRDFFLYGEAWATEEGWPIYPGKGVAYPDGRLEHTYAKAHRRVIRSEHDDEGRHGEIGESLLQPYVKRFMDDPDFDLDAQTLRSLPYPALPLVNEEARRAAHALSRLLA